MENILLQYASEFGISLDLSQQKQFDDFFDYLILNNEKFNLTSITEKQSVYLLHFADSLAAVKYISPNASVCDIGSGGGFPAIPIKIVLPDISLTMLDSVNKKVIYLNDAVKTLKLHKSLALHVRIEDYANSFGREKFDVVTARAVAKLPTLCEYALPLVKIGGLFLAYKSDVTDELKEAKNAINLLGGKVLEVHKYPLEDNTRNLVVIKKISPTPKGYPRGKNRERISPIL